MGIARRGPWLLLVATALALAACEAPAVTPSPLSTKPTVTPSPTPTPSPVSIPTPVFTVFPGIGVEALFQQNCAACHGAQRRGVIGPSLKAGDIQARGRTDEYLRQTITNGRGAMPAWKGRLSSAEIEALVKFLRS